MKKLKLAIGILFLIHAVSFSQTVWVLNNGDPDRENPPFNDSLKLFADFGYRMAEWGNFNISESISGIRRLAVTLDGSSCWVSDGDSLKRVHKRASTVLSIPRSIGALDIGRDDLLYALTSGDTIHGDSIVVFDPQGNLVDGKEFGGMDIVVDDKNGSVWIVGSEITRLNLDLQHQFTIDPVAWTATSVDYSDDGSVWIGEGHHPDVPGSKNRLLHIDLDGEILDSLNLTSRPNCVRVDRTDGSVLIAYDGLIRYIPSLVHFELIDDVAGFTLSIDQEKDLIWLAHNSGVNSYSKTGELQTVLTDFEGNDQKFIATAKYPATSVKTEIKLLATDGKAGDTFGQSVDIHGEFAVVGCPFDDNANGTDAGAVYIFRSDGKEWMKWQKITASDGTEGDIFGYSVSMVGTYLVVGAPWDDDHGGESGSAYIYKREGTIWTEEMKITASDAGADNRFGIDVDVSGDHVIVGAFFDNDFGPRSGSAYIFNREESGWVEQEILRASDGAEADWFGVSVSIDGEYAAVGSRYDDNENGVDAGAIYIFRQDGNNWPEHQKLTAGEGAEGDLFHVNTICGDVLLAGAYLNDKWGENAGSFYIYTTDGSQWKESKSQSSHVPGEMFGCSVAMSENRFAVGAYGSDENSGIVWLFYYDSYRWLEPITASDRNTGDNFGLSIALDGNNLIVAARKDDDQGEDAGAAYIYELVEPVLTNMDSRHETNPPTRSLLQKAYPNPFNHAATIPYSLPNAGHVNISIFNMYGQKVKMLADGFQEAGAYTIQWEGDDDRANPVPNGLYFCLIDWDNFRQSIKLLLIK